MAVQSVLSVSLLAFSAVEGEAPAVVLSTVGLALPVFFSTAGRMALFADGACRLLYILTMLTPSS